MRKHFQHFVKNYNTSKEFFLLKNTVIIFCTFLFYEKRIEMV